MNQSGTANVIVITDNFAQGSTMINQDVDTIFSEVGSHNGSGVMVFNNNGVVQVWYDSNVGLDQNGDGVILLGTITTGSAAADLASLTAAHFA